MAVITISRQFGAGGITLGKMVAEKFGYTFADTDIMANSRDLLQKRFQNLWWSVS